MLLKDQRVLLPANPAFIALSLVVAFMISLVPLGHLAWMPQFWLVVMLFWCLHQPKYVGITALFLAGLVMDVNDTTLLGIHAVAYSIAGCLVMFGSRRILWFNAFKQMPIVFVVFFTASAIVWMLRLVSGGQWPGWDIMLAPVLETLLWPFVSLILLAPQRRVPDRDMTRPL